MAPQFALFLSPEGIALAHRQTGGHWAVLGDTPLDVPDLGAALVVLRKLGEARAGKGFETLVILPDDQVLYTSLTAPGPDEASRLDQIRNGLDGLTPYAVEDLAFDWVEIDDGRVKLAVVAQETLEEAQEFCEQHDFTPAGYGARPLDNRYPGIAYFDRSLDWIAEIPDIEFGHDTWHPPRPEPIDESPDTDTETDRSAPTDGAEPQAPPADEPAPAAAAHEAARESAELDPGLAPAATAATADDPSPLPGAPDDSDADADTDADAMRDTGAPSTDQAPYRPKPDPEPAPPPAETALSAPDTPPEAAPPLTLGTSDSALPVGSGIPDTNPDAPDDQEGEATTSDDPAEDAPLQVPAGFGSHRRRGAPEAIGALVRRRKSRFGPGASVGEEGEGETEADLPRKRRKRAKGREEPVFGRAAKEPPVTTDPARASQRPDLGEAAPGRPAGAGPEPKLPPLARVKSRIEEHKAKTPPIAASNPFGTPPATEDDRPSLRDRVTGLGRQLSQSSTRLGRRGSDLGDKLRGLTRREPGSPDTATDAREPDPVPPPQAAPPDKTARTGKSRAKADDDAAVGASAAASAAQSAAAIAPPPADPPRRRFVPTRRHSKEPEIADSDAPIMGGLLARGSIATHRGPSLRTGLILTLILLAVLALIGVWATFYLPQTALGRWMGLGTEEEAVVVVETEPEVLDTPLLGGSAPSAEDVPPELAALTPGDTAPDPAAAAPQAPELLPDIDAEELDLGPAPVASPVIDPETVLPSEEENARFYELTQIWQRPPVITQPTPETVLEDVVFSGLDPVVASHDAIALPVPDFVPSVDLPRRQSNPVSPDTEFVLDSDGLVTPSADGTLNPDGILVFAGPPSVLPQPRPRDAPAALAAAEIEAAAAESAALPPGAVDTALLQAFRPALRPEDLQEQRERAVLGGVTFDELAAIRPEERPLSFQEQAAAEAAANVVPGDVTAASDLAVAVSFVPPLRPGNIEQMVEQARAAGNTGPVAPVAANRSDTIEPEIPSSASVTRAATEENAINLRNVNLIGVSGSSSDRRALVRLPSGRFVTVGVGDRLDGGQVAAIGESSLQYVKRGRTITLEVPSG